MITSIRVLPPGSGKTVGRILVKCFNEIALIEWTKKKTNQLNNSFQQQFSLKEEEEGSAYEI